MGAKITFSTDLDRLTSEDVDATSELAEEFFEMQNRPDEIPASEENREFILNKIPECDNVIRAEDKIIGFSLIIPCNEDIMKKFLSDEITENQLFEEVKLKVNYANFDTIYLCSSFIRKEFRGKGIAQRAIKKSIEKIIGKRHMKPILFCWPQTQEGEKSAKLLSESLSYELKLKK